LALKVALNAGQLRSLAGGLDEGLDLLAELLDAATGTILNEGLEATGGAHTGDRRRVERQHQAILLRSAHAHELARMIACIELGRGALAPVLERHEGHPGVAAHAEGEHVETGEGHHIFDCRMLHQLLTHRPLSASVRLSEAAVGR
jgi:hypothetical protein